MEVIETLRLNYTDLKTESLDKEFHLIDIDDFQINKNPHKMITVELIIYVDRYGRTKIIKNRFGDAGVVKPKTKSQVYELGDGKLKRFVMEVDKLCWSHGFQIYPTIEGWTGKLNENGEYNTIAVIGNNQAIKLTSIDGDGMGF